ncbi:MAG: UDP-N-acetylglucosamine:LPS N-acetylglucosamine transferase [Rubrobacteraceae bacterium]|nr:UDP-N-acetylglucosamine:LPS N-acetylglucosamine transferase [Rubrobacteraceae bacterium]
MSLVPQQGYTLHALPLTGLAGSPLAQARAGLLSLRATISCTRIIQRLRPLSVLGVGGYASAPAVIAARTLGVPTFLHEQNAVPGRVNRLASRFTTQTLATFPDATRRLRNAVWVGMPTRAEIFEASRDEALGDLDLEPPVVLIFGGSGGALRINLAAAEAFGGMTPYTVVQISGRRDFSQLSTDNPRHTILEFTGEIWRYLAAADLVVSRAGAGSLFDIAAAGKAAILVPFPYATGDHQVENARHFTERGAAELMLDAEVGARALRDRVEVLLDDDARREELARRMGALATPGAAGEVARRLLSAGEKE